PSAVAQQERTDGAFDLPVIEPVRPSEELDEGISGSGTVVLIDRVEHQSQGRLRARVEAADRAEVEQAERALGGDGDVSGVPVGMGGALGDGMLERGAAQGWR